MELTKADARMELAVLDAQSLDYDTGSLISQLEGRGLDGPRLSATREVWDSNSHLVGQTFHVGRIIIVEILNFLRANPSVPPDVAIGVATRVLSEQVASLVPILEPLAVSGAGDGRYHRRGRIRDGYSGAEQERLMALGRHFFTLLAAIFNTLEEELSEPCPAAG